MRRYLRISPPESGTDPGMSQLSKPELKKKERPRHLEVISEPRVLRIGKLT